MICTLKSILRTMILTQDHKNNKIYQTLRERRKHNESKTIWKLRSCFLTKLRYSIAQLLYTAKHAYFSLQAFSPTYLQAQLFKPIQQAQAVQVVLTRFQSVQYTSRSPHI
ncbi:hypothetical protein Hanom_Chr11g01002691 [Helianthus anomalus]